MVLDPREDSSPLAYLRFQSESEFIRVPNESPFVAADGAVVGVFAAGAAFEGAAGSFFCALAAVHAAVGRGAAALLAGAGAADGFDGFGAGFGD